MKMADLRKSVLTYLGYFCHYLDNNSIIKRFGSTEWKTSVKKQDLNIVKNVYRAHFDIKGYTAECEMVFCIKHIATGKPLLVNFAGILSFYYNVPNFIGGKMLITDAESKKQVIRTFMEEEESQYRSYLPIMHLIQTCPQCLEVLTSEEECSNCLWKTSTGCFYDCLRQILRIMDKRPDIILRFSSPFNLLNRVREEDLRNINVVYMANRGCSGYCESRTVLKYAITHTRTGEFIKVHFDVTESSPPTGPMLFQGKMFLTNEFYTNHVKHTTNTLVVLNKYLKHKVNHCYELCPYCLQDWRWNENECRKCVGNHIRRNYVERGIQYHEYQYR